MQMGLNILAGVAMATLAIVLVLGLRTMMKGDNPNASQRFMRMRIIAQAVALLVLLGVMLASGRGPGGF